jgi:hypothetical protein
MVQSSLSHYTTVRFSVRPVPGAVMITHRDGWSRRYAGWLQRWQ